MGVAIMGLANLLVRALGQEKSGANIMTQTISQCIAHGNHCGKNCRGRKVSVGGKT